METPTTPYFRMPVDGRTSPETSGGQSIPSTIIATPSRLPGGYLVAMFGVGCDENSALVGDWCRWLCGAWRSPYTKAFFGKTLVDIGPYANTIIQFPERYGLTSESAFSPKSAVWRAYLIFHVVIIALMSVTTTVSYGEKLRQRDEATQPYFTHQCWVTWFPWEAGLVRAYAKGASFLLVVDMFAKHLMSNVSDNGHLAISLIVGLLVFIPTCFAESSTLMTGTQRIETDNLIMMVDGEVQDTRSSDSKRHNYITVIFAIVASMTNCSLYWVSLVGDTDHLELSMNSYSLTNDRTITLAVGSAFFLFNILYETALINGIYIGLQLIKEPAFFKRLMAFGQHPRDHHVRQDACGSLPSWHFAPTVIGTGFLTYSFGVLMEVPRPYIFIMAGIISLIQLLVSQYCLRSHSSERLFYAAVPQTVASIASSAALNYTLLKSMGCTHSQSLSYGGIPPLFLFFLAVECCRSKYSDAWSKLDAVSQQGELLMPA